MSHHNTSTSVKALDLSRVLQHALLAGQKGIEWVDYDPTSNPAYQRIAECLEAKASGWRDNESDPPPETTPHTRGVWLHRSSTGERLYWQADTGTVCGGQFINSNGEDFGLAADDYTHWLPLTPPPGEEEGETPNLALAQAARNLLKNANGHHMHAEDRYVLEGLLDDLPDDVDNTDTTYQDAHRASVRSTIATSMKREEALRAENAELKRLITHMVEAIGKGAVDSEEIVPVPGDGPPYRFHEEWAHHARSALSPKEVSDGGI